MSLRSTRWLQEGKAVRRKEWAKGAFIILVKKKGEMFILSYWPNQESDIVFFPSSQLPNLLRVELSWPDTYECVHDQLQTRTFLLQRVPGLVFFNELSAISRAYHYFRYNRSEISRNATKRFVVISDDEVIGEYDEPIEAVIQTLGRNYALGEFIVQDLSVDISIFNSRLSLDSNEN